MYRRGFRRLFRCAFLLTLLAVLRPGNLVWANTFTVTNINDSGPGSLRSAMTNANFFGGSNAIIFNLSGTKPFTIALTNPLPVVNYPLMIDGTTQTNYSNAPVVELNGTNAGTNVMGLQLTGSSTVKGLAINRFNGSGILLAGASNVVQGCFIGTDTTGTNALPNKNNGILFSNAVGCLIGGTNAGARNIISGNSQSGLYLFSFGTTGNLIQGNYIGTDISGSLVVSNAGDGITINGAPANTIGVSNLISGNALNGISIYGSAATSNLVAGNFIGTDATGKTARGNGYYGLYLTNAVACQIGGTTNTGNIISGNKHGVVIVGGSTGNVIQGNLIGVAIDGTNALPNLGDGILISGGSTNTIGGVPLYRNVISGNGGNGVDIQLFNDGFNHIQGNYIGTTITGQQARSNALSGIYIHGCTNTVGGNQKNKFGNVIAGNGRYGVWLVSTNTESPSGNRIFGNNIGLDGTGANSLGNGYAGVGITSAAGNQIGDSDPNDRNYISANGFSTTTAGIYINGPGTTGNVIQNNYIGTDSTGASARPNASAGIVAAWVGSNTIGGAVSGVGNIISGNSKAGIWLVTTTNFVIQGNYIGLNAAGTGALGNGLSGVPWQGILIQTNTAANWIGGTTAAARNVISGNGAQGIALQNCAAQVIQGNYVGTDAGGSYAIHNGGDGIDLFSSISNNIGGTVTGAGNVVSGNNLAGIVLSNCVAQVIQGNHVGTDAGGSYAIHNGGDGIDLFSSVSNYIGGTVTGAGNVVSGNNTLITIYPDTYGFDGIYLASSSQNIIQGNFIGLAADGVSALTNSAHNVEFGSGSTNNILGGLAVGAGNRIAFAAGEYDGVRVRTNAYNNLISGNSIFSNTGLGIDLGNSGTNGIIHLETGVASTNANRLQNYPTITNVITGSATLVRGTFDSVTNNSYSLEFFASPVGNASGCGEGQVFLAQTNLILGSLCPTNFSFVLPATVPAGWVVTATATDPNNNTSEFSRWLTTTTVPALQARTNSVSKQITLSWATNSNGSFSLVQSTNLNPPRWVAAGISPVLSNGNYSVQIRTTNPAVFYRLLVQ